MRVHTRAWLKVMKKVFLVCVTSLHLAFSSLMSHPSLLFFDGHFETIPDFDVHTFTCPESAGRAHLRTSSEKFRYLAKSALNTQMSMERPPVKAVLDA